MLPNNKSTWLVKCIFLWERETQLWGKRKRVTDSSDALYCIYSCFICGYNLGICNSYYELINNMTEIIFYCWYIVLEFFGYFSVHLWETDREKERKTRKNYNNFKSFELK